MSTDEKTVNNDEFVFIILHDNAIVKINEHSDYDYLFTALDLAMEKVKPHNNADKLASELEADDDVKAELKERVPILAYNHKPLDDGRHLHQVQVSTKAYKEDPQSIKNLLRKEFINPSMITIYI